MHLNMNQIRNLAYAYLNNSILNDEQVEYKFHMSECDECYEKFCSCLSVFSVMKKMELADSESIGIVEEEELEYSKSMDVDVVNPNDIVNQNVVDEISKQDETTYLVITIKEKVLEIVNRLKEKAIGDAKEPEQYWNFIKRPQLAFSRGDILDSGDKKIDEVEIYESQISQYSYISRENGKLKIYLDSEEYDAEKIAIRYTCGGKVVTKNFAYDEEKEAYFVVIDENSPDDGKVEIIAKEK